MTKTIIFTTNPDSPQVQSLKEKGPVFVVNEEKAIKALQILKDVKVRGDYQVMADEGLKKYAEVAKKMGYQEYKEDKNSFADTLTIMSEAYGKNSRLGFIRLLSKASCN